MNTKNEKVCTDKKRQTARRKRTVPRVAALLFVLLPAITLLLTTQVMAELSRLRRNFFDRINTINKIFFIS